MSNEELHKVLEQGEEIFQDLEYHVEYKIHEYYIDFIVRKIYPTRDINSTVWENWWQGDSGPTKDKNEAEIFLTGDLKWDGCSNWDMQPVKNFLTHFCTRQEMVQYGELLGRLHDMGEKMATWIGDTKRGSK